MGFYFDADNRPYQINVPVEGAYQAISFKYGPDGARLKKITPSGTTLYLGTDRELSPQGVWTKNIHADVKRVGTALFRSPLAT